MGYLKGKIDPYEGKIASIIPRYNWSTTYSISELTSLLNSRGYGIGTVRDAYVSAYTDTGNVYSVTFAGTNGSKTVSREACRTLLNLRSQRFSINGGSGNAYSVNDTGVQYRRFCHLRQRLWASCRYEPVGRVFDGGSWLFLPGYFAILLYGYHNPMREREQYEDKRF